MISRVLSIVMGVLVVAAWLPAGEEEPGEAPQKQQAEARAKIARKLLKQFIAPDTGRGKRYSICERLVGLKNAAIRPIWDVLDEEEDLAEKLGRQLIYTLGRIGSKEAVPGLALLLDPGDYLAPYALGALAGINHRDAHKAILAHKPRGDKLREAHVRSLEKVPGEEAMQLLANYLISTSKVISARARQMIIRRSQAGIRDMVSTLRETIGKLQGNRAEKYPQHIFVNVLAACGALPDGNGTDLVLNVLDSDSESLRRAAIDLLLKHPAWLRKSGASRSLGGALRQEWDNQGQVIKLLEVCRKARQKATLQQVVDCLDHKDVAVRNKAADAMAAITGKNLGRNPLTWKNWYEENR